MRSHEAALRPAQAPPATISDGDQERRAWRRVTMTAVSLLALTGVFACACDAPMIWDGAYQFCFTLIKQQPYFYLTRFHSYVLWLPTVWLSHFTDNLTLLKFAYGLPFTLAPAFSVLASWWVVRDRAPHLILWAIFGAAAGPLPGQIFIINDSIFQQHMFWPVYMGVLVRLDAPRILLIALLVPFQFSHQIGLLLLAGAAGAPGILSLRKGEDRIQLLIKATIFTLLAAVALWKIFHFPDSYAQREFTRERIHESWQYGVEGYPLRGVALTWLAGGCILLHQMLGQSRIEKFRPFLRGFVALCIAVAALLWLIWAADPHKWSTAANYRRWVVPLTGPFYCLALLDRWRSTPSRPPSRTPAFHRQVGLAVAVVFTLVLSLQCIVWARMTCRLMRDVESSPTALVPADRIAWTRETAMYHWGTTPYVFVLEGRKPSHLLLGPTDAEAKAQVALLLDDPPQIPLSSFTPIPPTPGPSGWFDFRPLLYAAHHQPRP